jgi:hypothetical protein
MSNGRIQSRVEGGAAAAFLKEGFVSHNQEDES